MYSLFVILAVICAVLLTLIVLVQESKGGGLASDFSSLNNIGGVRKTTDLVEKLTWTFAGLLVVFSVATTFVDRPSDQRDASDVVTNMKTAPAAPATLPQAQQQQDAPAAQDAAPVEEKK